MLSAAYDGNESFQQPPFDYVMYRWRKEMGVTWQDASVTPIEVVIRDLEFINIERITEKAKLDNAKP